MDALISYVRRFVPATETTFLVPSADWWFADSEVDMDFENNRYFVPDLVADDNLVLLLHFDGADASTQFPDSTGRHSAIANGDAQVDTAESVFGGASLALDGSNDYVLVGNNSDFTFGTGDFTIDFRIKFSSLDASGKYLLQFGPDVGVGERNPMFIVNGNTMRWYDNVSGYRIIGTASITAGNWYHVAVTRASGSTRMFIDGTQDGSTLSDSGSSYEAYTDYPRINSLPFGGGAAPCWYDEVRIIKGFAAWTANFTPPSAAYDDPLPTGPYFALFCERASTGYAKNLDGTLTNYAANQLRMAEGVGLLTEESSTNEPWPSEGAFDSGTSTGVTKTNNVTTGPTGSVNAASLAATAGAGGHYWFNGNAMPLTGASGFTNSWSTFFKKGTHDFVYLSIQNGANWVLAVFDLNNGVVGETNVGGSGALGGLVGSKIESYTDNWYRCSVTGTIGANSNYYTKGFASAASGNSISGGNIDFTAAGTEVVYFFGDQFEIGRLTTTSYIVTTTAAATRAMDAVRGIDIGILETTLTAVDESVYMEATYQKNDATFFQQLVSTQNSGSPNLLGVNIGDTGVYIYDGATVLQAALGNSADWTDHLPIKVASAQDSSGRSVVGMGGTVATDTNDLAVASIQLAWGNGWNGTTQRIAAWSSRLSDARLQAITEPG